MDKKDGLSIVFVLLSLCECSYPISYVTPIKTSEKKTESVYLRGLKDSSTQVSETQE